MHEGANRAVNGWWWSGQNEGSVAGFLDDVWGRQGKQRQGTRGKVSDRLTGFSPTHSPHLGRLPT